MSGAEILQSKTVDAAAPRRDLVVAFRLPVPGWPRATFETTYGLDGGRLVVGGDAVVEAATRAALEAGVRGVLGPGGGGDAPMAVTVALVRPAGASPDDPPELDVRVADIPAPREDRLSAPTSRSAWIHAWLALGASAFGFAASGLYLIRAGATGDPWPLKMARHMAAWHLLLTLTLFPLSVWGQRLGIRTVQVVSAVFTAIHVGIAMANTGDLATPAGAALAACNAVSGALFLAATIYGNRAHRDMDPLRALPPLPAGAASIAGDTDAIAAPVARALPPRGGPARTA